MVAPYVPSILENIYILSIRPGAICWTVGGEDSVVEVSRLTSHTVPTHKPSSTATF